MGGSWKRERSKTIPALYQCREFYPLGIYDFTCNCFNQVDSVGSDKSNLCEMKCLMCSQTDEFISKWIIFFRY